MKRLPLISLLAPLVLAGCGGGGGGDTGSSSNIPSSASQSAVLTLFQAPINLPDLKPIYESLCGARTNLQNIFVADLNKDGKKDLVLSLWCDQPVKGIATNEPIISGIVTLIQQNDGSFVNGTRALFGTDYIQLGGIPGNAVVYDFNHDGYDDIVFGVNREDGRQVGEYPALNQNDYNAFITSNGKGGYDVIRQGQFAWNYSISLIENEDGSKSVMSIPIGYNGINEMWNYISGWKLDTSFQWLSGTNPLITKTKAFVEMGFSYVGFDLFTKTNGNWNKVDSYSFGEYVKVPWLSWQKNMGYNNLMNIDGKDYAGVTFEQKCNLKIKPEDVDFTNIIAMQANEIVGGYQGGTIVEGVTNLTKKAKILAFETKSNKITKVATFKIDNFIEKTDTYHLVCKDLNNDGYDDIMIQDWRYGTVPMIYLNDKAGGFNMVSTVNFPGLNQTQYTRGQSYIYEDLNGDGVRDLLYFPIIGLNEYNEYTSVKLKLYKGNRHFETKDLLPK